MANRYQNINTKRVGRKGTKIYKTVKYPFPSLSSNDLYVVTTYGDRFDILAHQYYGDSSLWWVISTANADILDQNSLYPPIGSQIRIPFNIQNILYEYKKLNQ